MEVDNQMEVDDQQLVPDLFSIKPINPDYVQSVNRNQDSNFLVRFLEIKKENFKNLNLENYPNLFIFKAVCNQNIKAKIINILEGKLREKSAIVQFTIENVNRIFFKYQNENFKEFKFENEEENFTFQTFLVKYLNRDFNHLMDSAIRASDELSLKFISTISPQECILKCIDAGNLSSLKIIFKNEPNVMTIMSTVFESQSILKTVIEKRQTEILKYLTKKYAKCFSDLPFDHQKEITKIAFDGKFTEEFDQLLNALNFPFPENFTLSSNIFGVLVPRIELSNAITSGNIELVKKFVDQNPKVKIGYSLENKSALEQCLTSNHPQLKILAFLESKRFYDPDSEKIDSLIDSLSVLKKDELLKERSEISTKNVKNHILALIQKSSILNRENDPEEDQDNFEILLNYYESIDSVKEVQPLLKIASEVKELRIIFDFDSKLSYRIDPSGKYAEGRCNYSYISIGANINENKEKNELKSTIIHEIAHFVFQVIFENGFKPFLRGEDERFDEIIDEFRNWSYEDFEEEILFNSGFDEMLTDDSELISSNSELDDECDGIISSVYKSYPSENHSKELIVRVPEILVRYQDDKVKIERLRRKYQSLFDFYDETLEKVLSEEKNLKNRRKVRKLNKVIGFLEKVRDLNYLIKLLQPPSFDDHKIQVTNIPSITLATLCQYLSFTQFYDAKFLFIPQNALENNHMIEKYNECKDFTSIIDCSGSLKNLHKILDFNNDKKFYIVDRENYHELVDILTNHDIMHVPSEPLIHSFDDLTDASKQLALLTKVTFQNREYKLKNFTNSIDQELLAKICKNSTIEINSNFLSTFNDESYQNHSHLYEPRKFTHKIEFDVITEISREEHRMYVNNYGKLLERLPNGNYKKIEKKIQFTHFSLEQVTCFTHKKYMIISDIAGSGKSWAYAKIIEKLSELKPNYWIQVVQLRDHFDLLASLDPQMSFKEIILKFLNVPHDFEREIFINLYDKGKVFLFFDGFDEACSKYKTLLQQILNKFDQNSSNQLWITTRSHLEVDLENLNNCLTLSLKPWDKNEQISMVKNLLRHNNVNEQTAESIVDQLSVNDSNIGLPQLLKILVKIHKTHEVLGTNLTTFKIYKLIVRDELENWSHKKGLLRREDSVSALMSQHTVINVHIYYAMKENFRESDKFCDLSEDILREWDLEKLAGCNFMTFNPRTMTVSFNHQTYVEYFSSQFVTNYLRSKKWENHLDFFKYLIDFMTDPKHKIVRKFVDEDLSDGCENLLNLTLQQWLKMSSQIRYKLDSILYTLAVEKLTTLLRFFLQLITDSQSDILIIPIKNAMFNSIGKTECFEKLLEFIERKFTAENFEKLAKEIIFDSTDKTVDKKVIEITMKYIEKKLNREGVVRLLQSKFDLKCNLLDEFIKFDVEKLETLWEFFENYLTNEQKIKMLKSKSTDFRTTILHKCATRANGGIIKFLYPQIERIIGREEMKNLIELYIKDFKFRHVLHLSAFNRDESYHRELYNLLKSIYSDEDELADLFNINDENGNKFLHCLVYFQTLDVMKIVFNQLPMIFTNSHNFYRVLTAKGCFNKNLLEKTSEKWFERNITYNFLEGYMEHHF